MIPVPHAGDYPAYFTTYIAYLNGADPLATLRQYALGEYIGSLPSEKLEYRYAAGKWTPKDILLHLADSERIFQYRILRFARHDSTGLQGFEENDYALAACANDRSLESLTAEYKSVRASTITLLESLHDAHWHRTGVANGTPVSVSAIAYAMAGHELHHLRILRERY